MKIFVALLIAALTATASAAIAKPTCGGTAATKVIQLLTPTYPPRECVYHINAYSKYVCQLRIDFSLQLAQPTRPNATNGLRNAQCLTDYVQVGGLRLCGTESNTHVYVPFNASAGVQNVDILFSLAARVGSTILPVPSWSFTVNQLECPTGAALRGGFVPASDSESNSFESKIDQESEDDSQVNSDELRVEPRATTFSDGFLLAPPGCLQYYPQSKGVIRSFNFNDGNGIYPGGMNYAICFRRTSATQGLELRSFFFQVGSAYTDASALALDSYCYTSQSSGNSNADFLMVPQAIISATGLRATYFCGTSMSQGLTITSNNPGPLMVVFNSDGNYSENDVGFDFNYKLL